MKERYYQTPALRRRNRIWFAHFESLKGTIRDPLRATARHFGVNFYTMQSALAAAGEEIQFEIEEAVERFYRLRRSVYQIKKAA